MTAALRCTGVTAGYADRTVLRALDLALDPGTVTVVLGPNGSGKTTLLHVLAGLLAPAAGSVELAGRPLASLPRREVARQLAIVGVEPDVAFAWTALEIVLMGRAPHLPGVAPEAPGELDRARSALAALDAADLAPRPVTELSAGERQRVLLARGLCQDTPVLLLDEPTSHLDPAHALRVAEVLRRRAAAGATVVWVAHDLNLAARAADRLLLLSEGRVVASGPPAEVLTPEHVAAVYGVRARLVPGDTVAVVLEPLP